MKGILKIRMITAGTENLVKHFCMIFKGSSAELPQTHTKGSSVKNISGMEIHFASGKEEKALMLFCYPHAKKQSAEWLRALKKVRLACTNAVLNYNKFRLCWY